MSLAHNNKMSPVWFIKNDSHRNPQASLEFTRGVTPEHMHKHPQGASGAYKLLVEIHFGSNFNLLDQHLYQKCEYPKNFVAVIFDASCILELNTLLFI